MERIVYVQEDHFEIPEKLLKLSHEELRKRIDEERKKEIAKKNRQLAKMEQNLSSQIPMQTSVNVPQWKLTEVLVFLLRKNENNSTEYKPQYKHLSEILLRIEFPFWRYAEPYHK